MGRNSKQSFRDNEKQMFPTEKSVFAAFSPLALRYLVKMVFKSYLSQLPSSLLP